MTHFILNNKANWLLSSRIFQSLGQLNNLYDPANFEGRIAIQRVSDDLFNIYRSNGVEWLLVSQQLPEPYLPDISQAILDQLFPGRLTPESFWSVGLTATNGTGAAFPRDGQSEWTIET